ncbi:MAG: monovalent cation:proton antiporter-2 (CPA2) family protein [Rhodocyclaceae bacterium]|nr:cation:proton antiporter [Rhodocyclaceae bacterium]MBX3668147.1 monovalent cation:proton antiporter-2 (CPA2) family protein [Rhodocyclaceae bacterium]
MRTGRHGDRSGALGRACVSGLLLGVVILGAAVLAVTLARRLGLGAVLGYLGLGVVVGPWGLGWIDDVEAIAHLAEFGVVLLLFVIGLELQPKRLWHMRRAVFGLGGAQVGATAVLLALIAALLGLHVKSAIFVGLALAMSSTAFALQMLAEKKQLTARHGRAAFSILLFQDLAVIPLLALIPLLGPTRVTIGIETLTRAGTALGMVALVALGGHFLLRPALRLVAASRVHEAMTASALFIVAGTALLMQSVGLSMGLGAFLAGLLLADSEYRHELEADIEPFKGLLLGLFFISVGMSVNLDLLVARAPLVAALTAGLIAVKFAVLYRLARVWGGTRSSALQLAFAISQGGEFAFVLFGVAEGKHVLDGNQAELLVVVVTLSMALTPFLSAAGDFFVRRVRPAQARRYDTPPATERPVIIAGLGRFGQIVARVLRARKIPFTALEIRPDQVDVMRQFGIEVYFGDASRVELLRAAQADQATLFVLAIDDEEASVRTAEVVTQHFPGLPIYARARNRKHAYRLMDLGIQHIRRETFVSSLELASMVLQGLGMQRADAQHSIELFRKHDETLLDTLHPHNDDDEKTRYLAQESARELEELMQQDTKLPDK